MAKQFCLVLCFCRDKLPPLICLVLAIQQYVTCLVCAASKVFLRASVRASTAGPVKVFISWDRRQLSAIFILSCFHACKCASLALKGLQIFTSGDSRWSIVIFCISNFDRKRITRKRLLFLCATFLKSGMIWQLTLNGGIENCFWFFSSWFCWFQAKMSSKVKITEIPGRGLGLLAINDIKAGDLILRGLFKFLNLES